MNIFLSFKNITVKAQEKTILDDISLNVYEGEHVAIVGKSGSGKTTLAKTIAGQKFYTGQINIHDNLKEYFTKKIVLVEQQHRFKNLSGMSNQFYYQQRYNSFDAADTVTVKSELGIVGVLNTKSKEIIELLGLQQLLDVPLIQLSNGENKRVQLAKALYQQPELLILDNPFIGLDVSGRSALNTIINTLIQNGQKLLLITTPQDVPSSITHLAVLENGKLAKFFVKDGLDLFLRKEQFAFSDDLLNAIKLENVTNFSAAIRMVNATVIYNDKLILKDINWVVNKGERWNVSGSNGAGKSTLLSLITADNPQAYANEIYLFDKRRGSGESIWDIKKLIGFVSPEMHLFFEHTATAFETIASGLFDTIGLFRKINEIEIRRVDQWLEILSLQAIKNMSLNQLSLGEQRLILLGRALIKNPPLLILDEPCQGLDNEQVKNFKHIVDTICLHFNTTLIYVSHYKNHLPSCISKELRLENGRQIKEFE
ncbi:MAG: ATP-binding cassette domain-containing protein [Ginsengibacter sp.]